PKGTMKKSISKSAKQRGLEIRGELLKKGVTLASLAREIGVHPSLPPSVLSGRTTSQPVRDAIIKKLGYDPFPPQEEDAAGEPGTVEPVSPGGL
ncbi:hypothetical protein LCGC14_2467400, partial [marine sediment metagenome]